MIFKKLFDFFVETHSCVSRVQIHIAQSVRQLALQIRSV
jgi:hypothetical protein